MTPELCREWQLIMWSQREAMIAVLRDILREDMNDPNWRGVLIEKARRVVREADEQTDEFDERWQAAKAKGEAP